MKHKEVKRNSMGNDKESFANKGRQLPAFGIGRIVPQELLSPTSGAFMIDYPSSQCSLSPRVALGQWATVWRAQTKCSHVYTSPGQQELGICSS